MLLSNRLNLKTSNFFKLILVTNQIKLFFYYMCLYYMYLLKILLTFKKKILFFKKKNLFFKKKNLFFKKKYNYKVLTSKRLLIALKKKKQLKKKNKLFKNNGNFFYKKFFFKTLIHCRKSLGFSFFSFLKIRQKKLTKKIQNKTRVFFSRNFTHDYNLLNVLLKGNLFLFPKDATLYIKSNNVYVNGIVSNDLTNLLNIGDCIQIKVFNFYYVYSIFFRRFLKQKIVVFKKSAWLFFKKNFLKKTIKKKFKKRKNPKFLCLLYLYKFNNPQYIEVDFITLSITLLRKLDLKKHKTYFLNKNFS